MKPAELTAEEQTTILADRYSLRAEAYDEFWSPVIRPVGERLIGHLPLNGAREIIDVGTGARVLELPAADNRACCDGPEKVTALLEQTGFITTRAWSESLEYRWRPEDHFEYETRSSSRLLLQSLGARDREACLSRVRDRLSGLRDDQYIYQGEVVMAMARKANNAGGGTRGVDDG